LERVEEKTGYVAPGPVVVESHEGEEG
jgi:hypothetical protein